VNVYFSSGFGRAQDAQAKWMGNDEFMGKRLNLSAFLFLGIIFFLIGRAVHNTTLSDTPSDELLKTVFAQRGADLELLLKMSNEDSDVIRIAPDFTWRKNDTSWPRSNSELGFSEERWNQYKELFKRMGIEDSISRDSLKDGCINFIVHSSGLVTGGAEKGFAYCTPEPSPLSESLEVLPKTIETTPFVMYKKLKDHWYLYIEID